MQKVLTPALLSAIVLILLILPTRATASLAWSTSSTFFTCNSPCRSASIKAMAFRLRSSVSRPIPAMIDAAPRRLETRRHASRPALPFA